MILDTLENIHTYTTLNKRFAKAIEFLSRADLKELPADKYDIDGEHLFAIVDKGAGRKKEDSKLETHEKYIDIQLVLVGTDEMGWKPKSLCKEISMEYNKEKDVQLYKGSPDVWLPCMSGTFAIFFPEDAHTGMISSGEIHKVIVKVAVV